MLYGEKPTLKLASIINREAKDDNKRGIEHFA